MKVKLHLTPLANVSAGKVNDIDKVQQVELPDTDTLETPQGDILSVKNLHPFATTVVFMGKELLCVGVTYDNNVNVHNLP